MNYFHIDLLSQFITLFTSLQKKLHNHEHTFVKSCCFLEALNVHSSKAETVELEVQSSVFFVTGTSFHDSNFILIRTLSALNTVAWPLFIVCKCLVL